MLQNKKKEFYRISEIVSVNCTNGNHNSESYCVELYKSIVFVFSSKKMWRFLLLAAVSCVEAAPAFPAGASDALSSASSVTQKATSSSAYASTAGGDASAVASAISAGAKRLTEAVASEMSLSQLRADAYVLTLLQVRKALHVGGCARDYSGCPVGYVDDGAACSPGSDYNGPCGAHALKSFSTSQKEDFAFKCGASWPCA